MTAALALHLTDSGPVAADSSITAQLEAALEAHETPRHLQPISPPAESGSSVCHEGYEAGQRASVYLMSVYTDGSTWQGSGTIIAGSGGTGGGNGFDRVLTAAHVVPSQLSEPDPEREGARRITADLAEVHAFGADGTYLASLFPVLIADERTSAGTFTSATIAGDVAVLEVTAFAPGVAGNWNGRGAPLAPALPDTMFMAFGGPDSLVVNRGASGSAVMDPEGRVLGVLSYGAWRDSQDAGTNRIGGYRTVLREKNVSPDLPEGMSDSVREMAGRPPVLMRGGMAIAASISQDDILRFLGQEPDRMRMAPAPSAGTVSAYPASECISEQIRILPMPDFPAPTRIDAHEALYFEIQEMPLIPDPDEEIDGPAPG